MKNTLITLASASLLFWSCSKDVEKITVTYTKGTGIYEDLAALRQTPLVEPARQVEDAGKIFLSNDLMLIGEEGKGIHVLDNSNLENPTPRLFMNIPWNREFFVDGSFLYAESVYDMLKIDISDPAQPRIVARIENAISNPMLNGAGEALVHFELKEVTEQLSQNDNIYDVIWENDGQLFLDFEGQVIPKSAVPASFAGSSSDNIGSVNRMATMDEYLFVVSRTVLSVYHTSPAFERAYSETIGWNMETVYPFGDRIFIGTNASVEIMNVSDPTMPTYENSFWHANSCDPVLPVSEETAYATLRTGDFVECPGDENALVVLDVEPGSWDVGQVQEIEMESPYGLTMIGDLLYVGEGENGLKIFDASDERNLRLVEHDRSVTAYDVLAHPYLPNVLLVTGPDGLGQYDTGGDQMVMLSNIPF